MACIAWDSSNSTLSKYSVLGGKIWAGGVSCGDNNDSVFEIIILAFYFNQSDRHITYGHVEHRHKSLYCLLCCGIDAIYCKYSHQYREVVSFLNTKSWSSSECNLGFLKLKNTLKENWPALALRHSNGIKTIKLKLKMKDWRWILSSLMYSFSLQPILEYKINLYGRSQSFT